MPINTLVNLTGIEVEHDNYRETVPRLVVIGDTVYSLGGIVQIYDVSPTVYAIGDTVYSLGGIVPIIEE